MSVSDELSELEEELKGLRVAYEKYFAGVDKVEPNKVREVFRRKLLRLQGQRLKNTALRFRMQTVQSSLVTHEQYWNRVVRQIEEGTFKRNKLHTKRRPPEAAIALPTAAAASNGSPAPGPTQPTYPAAIQQLYESFAQAQRQAGDERAVSIAQLARTVQIQYKTIKERFQCRTVEFKVTVKDGKAMLTAVPKN